MPLYVHRLLNFTSAWHPQDVLHRVTTPSQLAGGRPRFSLVWKLAFLPRSTHSTPTLARPEWGPSTAFGSAARLDALTRAVSGQKRKLAAKGTQRNEEAMPVGL